MRGCSAFDDQLIPATSTYAFPLVASDVLLRT